ncbi:hypothetical protein GINT2_000858 [Glugoides intestinalis]
MEINTVNAKEVRELVGITEELTDNVLYKLKMQPPSKEFLSTYSLLLIERFEETLLLVIKAMEEDLDTNFLYSLQQSRFYLHRMAVPIIIRTLTFPERKVLLRNGLKDPICEVVKQSVNSIKNYCQFDNTELLEIALELFKSKYTAVKILTVDALAMIGESSFLLASLITSTNWRIRLKVASRFAEFNSDDQTRILLELKKDHIDEVRVELSKGIKSLEHLDLLGDPCESVRANYLSNIIDFIRDEQILVTMMQDSSWEVKKILLGLKGEMFKNVTIPLIKNSTENVSWRIKYEIMTLIDERVSNEFASKLLMSFLIKNVKDKVCEIRRKAQRILVKIIRHYDWVSEYFLDIESLVSSTNYLYRISAIPIAIEYDLKFKTELGKVLKHDKVINVRDYFRDYSSKQDLNIEYCQTCDIDPDTSVFDSHLDNGKS